MSLNFRGIFEISVIFRQISALDELQEMYDEYMSDKKTTGLEPGETSDPISSVNSEMLMDLMEDTVARVIKGHKYFIKI